MAKSKSSNTIRPIYDKLVVEKIKSKEISAGGIILPDQAKAKPTQGIVLAIGEGAVMMDGNIRPMRVKVGQTVIFGKYAGHEADTEFFGENIIILREDDVMGIVE